MRLTLIQMNSRTASRDDNVARACASVDEAARQKPDMVVLPEFFHVEYFPQYRYDTAMLINPQGEIAGKYRKVHPAALLSLEKIYFRGGSSFPVFRVGEWTIGFSICYDNLFPESCRCLALHGAELIIAPYATPVADPWENFLTIRARQKFPLFRDRRPDAYATIARATETLHL